MLQVGALFAPFVQGLNAQLLPFHVLPDAQLAVTVLESSVVPPFLKLKTVEGFVTHTVIPEEFAAVERVPPVFPSTRLGEEALVVLHDAVTVQVLAPPDITQLEGDTERDPVAGFASLQ